MMRKERDPSGPKQEWREDCMEVHGRVLTGIKRHRCPEWDFLPIDETVVQMDACLCELDDLFLRRGLEPGEDGSNSLARANYPDRIRHE